MPRAKIFAETNAPSTAQDIRKYIFGKIIAGSLSHPLHFIKGKTQTIKKFELPRRRMKDKAHVLRIDPRT